MSEYQIQETFNARAAQNREETERQAALAYENERIQQAAYRNKRRLLASIKATIHALIAFGVVIGTSAAMRAGLISSVLAIPVMLFGLSWITFWFGAWMQFMWCKGGLMEWRK